MALAPDSSLQAARAAHLRWVVDDRPGIRRRRAGKGFVYVRPDGARVKDPAELARLKALVLPPAWTDVWICPSANGHIQATGRDQRGRKQYRYHARWREVRDQTKYERVLAFGAALPKLRARVEEDLGRPGLPREKVLATVVKLLGTTLIRVGNREYAEKNNSFGLTTLRDEHVDFAGARIRFHFRGKSGKEHTIDLQDRRLAKIIHRCQEIEGEELFQYVDGAGARHVVESADVNGYIREATREELTAKDFRTFAGTVLFAQAVAEMTSVDSRARTKKALLDAIARVAERLGNTKAVCRKCYVHPAVMEAYLEGATLDALRDRADEALREGLHDLTPEEAAVMMLLRERLGARSKVARRAA